MLLTNSVLQASNQEIEAAFTNNKSCVDIFPKGPDPPYKVHFKENTQVKIYTLSNLFKYFTH